MPDIVGRFTQQHPLVELSVVCHPSVALAERIMTGEIDVAIVTDCERIKGLGKAKKEPATPA